MLNIRAACVYHIGISAAYPLRSSVTAFIVNKSDPTAVFNPTTNPCALPFATPRPLSNAFGSNAPAVDDFVYLGVGFYDLIVTCESAYFPSLRTHSLYVNVFALDAHVHSLTRGPHPHAHARRHFPKLESTRLSCALAVPR
eukprot:TRINITY_DN4448_c0_g1_i1.p1 TRINITY_DN4448_c0_g1~~TRINITY_DN4448_c0_g1_i1.p1  ORF type:complete len:141 (-),score=8.37 TRINITY_DN4448_c0_g1_i1:177-599(-)